MKTVYSRDNSTAPLKYLAALICLLLCCFCTANAQDASYSIELPVSQQPSALVNLQLFRDRYGLIDQMQHFATKITNLSNQKVRVTGTLTALLYCGNTITTSFDYVIDPGASIGPAGDDLHSNTFGTVFKESCNNPQQYPDPNNPQYHVYNRIRSVSIANFSAAIYKDEDDNTAGSGTVAAAASGTGAYGNTTGSGTNYHTAMNANNPNGNTNEAAQQLEARRTEQLRILDQQMQTQAQQYNAMQNGIGDLLNLFLSTSFQKSINQQNSGRDERFEALKNDISTKHGSLADCSECNGQGYTTCDKCSGRGYTICSDCNGNGKKQCYRCSGTGYAFGVRCITCNGTGYEQCNTCFGKGKNACINCYGIGRIQCIHCRGTGKEFKEEDENSYNNTSSYSTQQGQTTNMTGNNASANEPGATDCFNTGVEYFNRQDYATALVWYQKAAAKGSIYASNGIAMMYENGLGVPQNYALAMQWYQQSAARGDNYAKYLIGNMYYNGEGVPVNYDKALQWFMQAATGDKADDNAMYGIASIYYYGKGLPQNYALAFEWYQKVIAVWKKTGQVSPVTGAALFGMGWLYEYGQGVVKNSDTAITWYRQGASIGNVSSINRLKQLGVQN
jgi:tetratricopeptide (TPR) repeat protein